MEHHLRSDASVIFNAAVEAVLPRSLVERSLQRSGDDLAVRGTDIIVKLKHNVHVYAFGKAVLGMVTAVDCLCHDHIVSGIASVPCGMVNALQEKLPHLVPSDTCRIEIVEGAEHNVPDENAHTAAKRILKGVHSATADDVIIILVSGGGSALLPLPADGLTLRDKRETTLACARRGASINELNTIRKHLSAVKGGQLAAAAYPASVITLVLSDVVGDPLDVIASGPTVPDPTSFRDCQTILDRLHLNDGTLPARVMQHLEDGVAGRIPDTPTADVIAFQPRPPRVHTTQLVGTNAISLQAAQHAAEALGYVVVPWGCAVETEARTFAKAFAARLEELHSTRGQDKICLLGGGETTCAVKGTGRGGRNQEIALQAALCLPPSSQDSLLVLSGGTDGQDGPTDAAGGVGHGGVQELCASLGLCATDFLENNDSYALLDRLGLHLRTGLTGTNVMDVFIGLAHPR